MTERIYCPQCRWWDDSGWHPTDIRFHHPDCPVVKRWEAVRPATCPCCGEPTTEVGDTGPGGPVIAMFDLSRCPGFDRNGKRADEAWMKQHPEVAERHRELTVAEQLRTFLYNGIPVTHVRVYRSMWRGQIGQRWVESETIVRDRY